MFAEPLELSTTYQSSVAPPEASPAVEGVTTIGLVQGSAKFHHATLRVQMGIALAGGSSLGVAMGPQTRQRTVDVTSSATITSSDAAVVEAVGSRLKALSAGSAVITASFDALSGTEQVVVVASVEDPLTTMELSASLSPAGAGSSTPTLNLVQGGTTQGSLRLASRRGVWSDVSRTG